MAPPKARSTSYLYQKARRDEDKRTREEFRTLIPQRYLDEIGRGGVADNWTTVAMKAAIAYLRDIQPRDADVESEDEEEGKEHSDRHKDEEKQRSQCIAEKGDEENQFKPTRAPSPPSIRTSVEYQAFKQAMARLRDVIATRAKAEGGVSAELRRLLDEGNDLAVDIIRKVEGLGDGDGDGDGDSLRDRGDSEEVDMELDTETETEAETDESVELELESDSGEE